MRAAHLRTMPYGGISKRIASARPGAKNRGPKEQVRATVYSLAD